MLLLAFETVYIFILSNYFLPQEISQIQIQEAQIVVWREIFLPRILFYLPWYV